METNYSPGQILYIQSTENFFYISVMHSMQPHPVVDDANRCEVNTCCDLCVDVYNGEMYPASITFSRGGNGSIWDLDVEFDEIRPAHGRIYNIVVFLDNAYRGILFDILAI